MSTSLSVTAATHVSVLQLPAFNKLMIAMLQDDSMEIDACFSLPDLPDELIREIGLRLTPLEMLALTYASKRIHQFGIFKPELDVAASKALLLKGLVLGGVERLATELIEYIEQKYRTLSALYDHALDVPNHHITQRY